MEVACSSASPIAPHHNCSSLNGSDDVSDDVTDDVQTELKSSPAAAAAAVSCHGDTPPPSSPRSQDDAVKSRLYLMQRHHHRHHHHHSHHGDALSPRLPVSRLQQPPPRTRCSLDVASIVATDNRVTFLDNR